MPLLGSLEWWALLRKESLGFRMQQQKLQSWKTNKKKMRKKATSQNIQGRCHNAKRAQHTHNGDMRRRRGWGRSSTWDNDDSVSKKLISDPKSQIQEAQRPSRINARNYTFRNHTVSYSHFRMWNTKDRKKSWASEEKNHPIYSRED